MCICVQECTSPSKLGHYIAAFIIHNGCCHFNDVSVCVSALVFLVSFHSPADCALKSKDSPTDKDFSVIQHAGRDSFAFFIPFGNEKSRCRSRQAGIEQQSTGLLHKNLRVLFRHTKKEAPAWVPLFWYAGRDSNPQPSEPESDALSIEPPARLPYSLYIIAIFFRFVKREWKNFFCFVSTPAAKRCCFLPCAVV